VETGAVLHSIDGSQEPLWPDNLSISPNRSMDYVYDRFSEKVFLYGISSKERHDIESDQIHFFEDQTYALWSELLMSVWSYKTLPPVKLWDRSYETEIFPVFKEDQIWINRNDADIDILNVVDAKTGIEIMGNLTKPEIVLPSGRLIEFPMSDILSARLQVVDESKTEDLILRAYTVDLFNPLTGEIVSSLNGTLEGRSVMKTVFHTGQDVWVESPVRLAVSWGGRTVVIGMGESAKVWEVENGQLLFSENHLDATCNVVAFSQDNKAVTIQFKYDEGATRHQSLWSLAETPVQVLSEEFQDRVNVRFSDDALVLDTGSQGAGFLEIEYDKISGDFLSERMSFGNRGSVSFSRAARFQVELRIIEQRQDDFGVTQILEADMIHSLGSNSWFKSLEGGMVSRHLHVDETTDDLLFWQGLLVPELSAIVVGMPDSVGMWNHETGEQLFSVELGTDQLPRSIDTRGYNVTPVRLSQDKGRVLVEVRESILNPESGNVDRSYLRSYKVIDIESQEVFSLPEFAGPDGVEFDQNLNRALVYFDKPNGKSDIWDFQKSTVLATIPGDIGGSVGLSAGSLESKVNISGPVFSNDGEILVTASSDGVAFWAIPGLNPGLRFRRDESGLSLVWDETLIDDSFRLQVSDSVTAAEWQDVEKGQSGDLKIDTELGDHRFYRWRQ
jgi:WD40 repeat protein